MSARRSQDCTEIDSRTRIAKVGEVVGNGNVIRENDEGRRTRTISTSNTTTTTSSTDPLQANNPRRSTSQDREDPEQDSKSSSFFSKPYWLSKRSDTDGQKDGLPSQRHRRTESEELAGVGDLVRLQRTSANGSGEENDSEEDGVMGLGGAGTAGGGIYVSKEDDKRVLRKIDRVLMPLMMAAYTLQYIDKSAMSYAAIFTFRADTNLSPHQYQWLGSAYYFGYLAFSLPNAYFLQKFPLKRYLGACILVWGVMLVLMSVFRTFAGLCFCRVALGMSEGVITPGFVLLISRFYKREEQPLRVGIWYCCNGLGSFIGGLISYGTGHIDAGPNVPNWIWIFVINGTMTIIVGVVFLWICPEQAESAWFLTPEERMMGKERVRGNMSSLESKVWKWDGMGEALLPWRDLQGWILFLLVTSYCIPNGGLGNFLHLILQSYGFSPLQTILVGLPQAAAQVFIALTGSYIARRFRNSRTIVMMIFVLPSLAGVSIQYATRNTGALLFGYYILPGFVAGVGQAFAMPGANATGYTKRCTVSSMVYVAYSMGNIIGPHFFDSTENPPYRSGMFTCIICFSISIPLALGLRLLYRRQNKRRDEIMAAAGKSHDPTLGTFEDVTDQQNLNFRYHL